jgi:hypothetical protein
MFARVIESIKPDKVRGLFDIKEKWTGRAVEWLVANMSALDVIISRRGHAVFHHVLCIAGVSVQAIKSGIKATNVLWHTH